MSSRMESYRVRRRDNLADPEYWNGRFADIDNRINAREQDSTRIDNAVDDLEAVALQRLNDTFTPLIVEAQDRLNNLGASFSAESLAPQTIGTGEKDLLLTEATAETYVFTDYVQVRSASNPDKSMLGQVIGFDRGTRLLSINVVHVEGSGTFSDWLIRVGAPIDLSHADRTDNPHETTASQVGAYTTSQVDAAIIAAIEAIPGVDLTSRLATALNLSDLTDKAAARTNLGLKLLATQDTLGFGQLASNIIATAANFLAKTPSKLLTAESAWDAAVPVLLNNVSGAVALDLSAGINFYLTLAGPITLSPVGTPKNGQSGGILIYQGAGAGRTVSYGGGWYPINAQYPALSTVATAYNYLTYQCMFTLTVFSGGKLTG